LIFFHQNSSFLVTRLPGKKLTPKIRKPLSRLAVALALTQKLILILYGEFTQKRSRHFLRVFIQKEKRGRIGNASL
jgi:hypothetical protein